MSPRLAMPVLAVLAAACAGDPARLARGREVVAVEALAVRDDGADEAARRARSLLSRPDLQQDHRCAVLLALGRALARQGRDGEALQALATLGSDCADHPAESARGLLEVAALAGRSAGPGARLEALERVVTAFPREAAARRALEDLRDADLAAGGPDAAVARMARLHGAVPGTPVAANLLFEAARLREGQGTPGALAEARTLYGRVADEHPASGLSDDALIRGARLALALGDPRDACARLESLLARRHWSFLMVSYDVPVYADAAFLLAEATLAAGDRAGAADRWRAFARQWPRDRRAAEALRRADEALR